MKKILFLVLAALLFSCVTAAFAGISYDPDTDVLTVTDDLQEDFLYEIQIGSAEGVKTLPRGGTVTIPEASKYLRGAEYVTVYVVPFSSSERIPIGSYPIDPGDEPPATSGSCGEHLTWMLDSEGTLTIFGIGDMDDYTLKDDGGTAPWGTRPVRVVIQEGVGSIGDLAFYGCGSLTGISIPESVVSIGKFAFFGCVRLTNIILPESAASVDKNAFMQCSGLTAVTVLGRNTVFGDLAFLGCKNVSIYCYAGTSAYDYARKNGISTVLLSDDGVITLPAGLTIIGNSAFRGTAGEIFLLPEGTETIEDYAFAYLQKPARVYIPATVKSIGKNAFKGSTVVLVCPAGSTAETWAIAHKIPVENQ